jgi:hypothetical protein
MPHVAHYIGLLHKAQVDLAAAFREVADGHADEVDVFHTCNLLARECDRHARDLEPFVARYGEDAPEEPDRLHAVIFQGRREGGLGLLRDLQDLYLMAAHCDITWTLLGQAAKGLRDADLLDVVTADEQETAVQLKWLRTRMKEAAPQALVVA